MQRGGGIFWEGGVDYERVAHLNLLKRGIYSGGGGIFWEGRTYIFVEKGVIFWEVGVDSERVAHIHLLQRGGMFWEGGVDSETVAHLNLLKRGIYSGGGEGYILGRSHIYIC